jgi:hypothetical protein
MALAKSLTALFLGGIEECPPGAVATISKVTLPFSATLIEASKVSNPGKIPSKTKEPSSSD